MDPVGRPGLFDRETSKPKNTSETLRRFGHYLKPYWPVLLLAPCSHLTSTWAQVNVPELLGQATDCYLTPPRPSREHRRRGGRAVRQRRAPAGTNRRAIG